MNELTVWYDGACPLCSREIALMGRLDRSDAITFVDLSPPSSTCPIDRNLMLERLHVKENDRLLSGSAAFAAMWRAIPILRPLGLAAQNPMVLSLLEWFYRLFLRVRPWLQRLAVAGAR